MPVAFTKIEAKLGETRHQVHTANHILLFIQIHFGDSARNSQKRQMWFTYFLRCTTWQRHFDKVNNLAGKMTNKAIVYNTKTVSSKANKEKYQELKLKSQSL